MSVFFRASLAALLICVSSSLSIAAELSPPTGDVMLTVSGDIESTNVGNTAQFDMEMLLALPTERFETSTTWTEGVQQFEGVSLAGLMDALGITEGTLKATAVNDYAVDIPVADAVAGGPIIAYHLNGKPMPLRDKGPLWIVYPYDANSDYQSEVIYSRSIWQLDRIVVGE